MSLGFSIWPLASASVQFLVSQRRSRAVDLHINARRGTGSRPWVGAKEVFRQGADPQGKTLKLPGIHLQPGMRQEILLRVDERLAGSRPTDQTGQCRGIAVDQAQGLIQGESPGIGFRGLVPVALDLDLPKQGVDRALHISDAPLPLPALIPGNA